MERVKIFLKNLIGELVSRNNAFKRNVLKEYFQILVLNFIYSHPEYAQLIFYGGSCLAHCFGLPRLSEDLDFVDLKGKIDVFQMAKDIEAYFKNNTDLDLTVAVQKFRIYLKFPVLQYLGLSSKSQTNLLFLKIETFNDFSFCKKYDTEIVPLFKFNKSILIKTFDMPTLMSTKIRAILYRRWEKTDKKGKILAKVKGRDYFDLMWYLDRKVKPNIFCIENIRNTDDLKRKLLKIVEDADQKSILFDLEALIDDKDFVKNLSTNIKDILKRKIIEM